MQKGLIGKSGVYAIIINAIIRYIGSTGSSLESRKSYHLAKLRKGQHPNKELQELFNLFGEERFEFVVLEYCKKSDTYVREQYYMEQHEDTIVNKNKIKDTHKYLRRGKKSVEHRANFSEINSGELNPHCTKLSEEKIFNILDMVQAGIDKKEIATRFNINTGYIGRIGKDRWINTYQEWKSERVATSANVTTQNSVTAITL